jgi:hypothetical protein
MNVCEGMRGRLLVCLGLTCVYHELYVPTQAPSRESRTICPSAMHACAQLADCVVYTGAVFTLPASFHVQVTPGREAISHPF